MGLWSKAITSWMEQLIMNRACHFLLFFIPSGDVALKNDSEMARSNAFSNNPFCNKDMTKSINTPMKKSFNLLDIRNSVKCNSGDRRF